MSEKKFKEKYGKDAFANSVDIDNIFFVKQRKQKKWILYYTTKGKIKFFNDNVKKMASLEMFDGYLPQIPLICSLEQLKKLNNQIEKIIKRENKNE